MSNRSAYIGVWKASFPHQYRSLSHDLWNISICVSEYRIEHLTRANDNRESILWDFATHHKTIRNNNVGNIVRRQSAPSSVVLTVGVASDITSFSTWRNTDTCSLFHRNQYSYPTRRRTHPILSIARNTELQANWS